MGVPARPWFVSRSPLSSSSSGFSKKSLLRSAHTDCQQLFAQPPKGDLFLLESKPQRRLSTPAGTASGVERWFWYEEGALLFHSLSFSIWGRWIELRTYLTYPSVSPDSPLPSCPWGRSFTSNKPAMRNGRDSRISHVPTYLPICLPTYLPTRAPGV